MTRSRSTERLAHIGANPRASSCSRGIAIVPESAKERDLRSEPLFVEDLVCVLRRRHPLATGRWTLRRFAEQEHVVVAPLARSRRGAIDALLQKRGLSRRVTRVVTSFTSALPLIVDSDRLAILPRSFAKAHAEELGLAMRPLPLALPPIEMSLVWYLGNERDAKHAWTRGLVRDAVRSAGLTSSLP